MKRILITGAAGFLGSHLCDRFISRGDSVLGMDNLLTGSQSNLKHLLRDRRFRFEKKDVSKPFKVSGHIDAVLHFASPASPPDYLKFALQTMQVGSFGTYNALELAQSKKAVFMLASTSEIYGDPLISPQIESYWGHVSSVGPRAVYDEAKRFAEAMTSYYFRERRVNAKIIRIFNTYGPRMRVEDGRVIPNFICQALQGKSLTVYGNGDQTRSYCYVDDLVHGIEKNLASSLNEPVNLGNPNEMSVHKLADVIIRLTNSKSKIVHKALPMDDPRQRCPDISLARRILKWSPNIDLEDGLARTIDYFREAI